MKVAFIEPSILNVEPMGIGYLAQVLINNGYEVKYFETPRKNFLKRLKQFNPSVLAYSIITGKHRLCRDINRILRRKIDAISLFGGPHCTFYPEFIESDEFIDGICRGEGEEAIVDLLDRIKCGEDYRNTENWWLRVDGKIYKNSVRHKIQDIDSISFPNREVIYAENGDLRDTPIKRILASRGCPFTCSYCFNRKYNLLYEGKGSTYRLRSPENIAQEINEIRKKYPITFLKFVDDIFGLSMDYDEFAKVYKRVEIPFLCNIRPNFIDEYKIGKLKELGCVAVTIAIESGNEFVRNELLNRNMPEELINKAISILKRKGIKVWTQNIIGNPGETFKMAMDTFNINVKNNVDFAECFILTPYPGTEIYKYCAENNYLEKDVDDFQISYWLGSSIRFSTPEEKRRFVNFHKFFSFAVQHPGSLPLIKLLIKLPPNKLFVLFNRLYDAWKVNRIVRAKFTVRNFITTVRVNLEFILTYFMKEEVSMGDFKKGSGCT